MPMHKMTVKYLGMIGPEEKFYGYIVGLSLERGDLPDSPDVPARMFARFEYSDWTSVAEVPDFELFRLLAGHLKANAEMRAEFGDWGYSKVWISKKNGKWSVELP